MSSAFNLFHTYIAASVTWYLTRAFCRVYDPAMVVKWFRPPIDASLITNDLELYNIRTDAWGLATIALLLLTFTNAVPNPLLPSPSTQTAAERRVVQSYARMAVMADIFHHVMTGLGAWRHYALITHYNTSMAVGVWGCAALAGLGAVTLLAPAGVSGLGAGAAGVGIGSEDETRGAATAVANTHRVKGS